jgi:hypothetical protein
MSARAASSALILILLTAPGFFRPAQAGPWLPGPGEYYTELRGGLFSADTYRNSTGDRIALGGKWEERSILSTIELGWKKRLSVVIAAPFISATRQDPVGDTTSTGLEDFRFGLRYGLLQGPTALAAEFDWQTPLGYSRRASLFSDSLRGGGLQQLSLSLLLGKSLAKRGFLQLGTGVGYRFLTIRPTPVDTSVIDKVTVTPPRTWRRDVALPDWRQPDGVTHWSCDFKTSADAGFWVTRSILVGGRWSGTFNLGHGVFAPEQNTQLLGPVVVWRVDDRLDLTAGSWSTAMAKNSLHYDQVYVAVAFKQTRLNRLQGFLGGTKAP